MDPWRSRSPSGNGRECYGRGVDVPATPGRDHATIPAGVSGMTASTQTTIIEIDRQTADALQAQARVRGVSLDAYLRVLVSAAPGPTAAEHNDEQHPIA